MTGGMQSLLLRLGFLRTENSTFLKGGVGRVAVLFLTGPRYGFDHYTLYDSRGIAMFTKTVERPGEQFRGGRENGV